MLNRVGWLYETERPRACFAHHRRHCHEAILVARATPQHLAWIRALQQCMRRQRPPRPAQSETLCWPRRYRLGEMLRFHGYTTVSALALLLENRQSALGFCAFAVGAGAAEHGVRVVDLEIASVWIRPEERGQLLSELLCARVAQTALEFVGRLNTPRHDASVARFELRMRKLTHSGHGFLRSCERHLDREHDGYRESFAMMSLIDHTPAELESAGVWTEPDDELIELV